CDLCAPSGIQVGLENSPNSPAETPHQMQEWAARINRPNLGFVLDVTHARQSNLDPLDFIRTLPSLVHFHVSDYHPQNGPHQPIGLGKVDWRRLAGALHRSRFEGYVVLELATSTVGEDPAVTLRESVSRLSAWLDIDRGEQ
ncbi:MAG TPA: sugar phosphate isomerase/epimerase, partial [Anaerolineae bacterium]|nr:sugar phosphate isomerase/epimerase [Anaerolineae bacterium]